MQLGAAEGKSTVYVSVGPGSEPACISAPEWLPLWKKQWEVWESKHSQMPMPINCNI